MAEKDEDSLRLRTATLSHRKPTRFRWQPEAEARARLAEALELPSIAALEFRGEIRPAGRHDFELEATLTADLEQACVVTLAPVPARILDTVQRRWVADWAEPEAEEMEISADDISEPMPEVIDLTDVAREALELALPPYPRAPGAELGEAVFAAPGLDALRDEDLRPFAGLAKLVAKAEKDGGDEGGGQDPG